MAQAGNILFTTIGHLPIYDANQHKFMSWYGQFEEYCMLNNIGEEPVDEHGQIRPGHNRRRALFLTHVGSRAFEVLTAAVAPQIPRNFSIPDLSALICQKFEDPGLEESNRILFHARNQQDNESVFDYISVLQTMACSCNFGAAYDMTMKSRLIAGIRHVDTKAKLLSTDINFDRAKEIAINDDRLRMHMRILASQSQSANSVSVRGGHQPSPRGHRGGGATSSSSGPSNSANPGPSSSNRGGSRGRGHRGGRGNGRGGSSKSNPDNDSKFGPCHRCGRRHDVKSCPAVNWSCYNCKKKGHIAPKCRSKKVEVVEEEVGSIDNLDNLEDLLSRSHPFSTVEQVGF